MRSSYARGAFAGNKGRSAYVSFADGTVHSPMCGHNHETIRQALNCGGNAFKVIRTRDTSDKRQVNVTFKRVSS